MTFPSSQFPQIYEVGTEGDRPVMFSSIPMEDISISPDGKSLLYHDKKGYEDAWRKHHTSSITRDIWLCTEQEGTEKVTGKLLLSTVKTELLYGLRMENRSII